MSYMRTGYPMKYVKGESSDYLFSTGEDIEDYGSMENESIIEILFSLSENNKEGLILKHMAKRLAENLNIKLRKQKEEERKMNKIKLCKKCKKTLLKELKGNPRWKMTYGVPAFKIVNELIELIENSHKHSKPKKGENNIKRWKW